MRMSNPHTLLQLARRPDQFTRALNNIQLRPYQVEPFLAILDSIFNHRGLAFVIIFARQSGKDELIANLIVFLLARLQGQAASIVCAQPTFKPQTLNAMQRLETRLNRPWFSRLWKRTGGYQYHFGRAKCTYFSAGPTANVVGETARTLLIINEAQDVEARVYDKNFAPMAASGNATRIFSGTSWTSNTLLSRELRTALAAEQADGRRRVFIVTGEEVGKCNSYYAGHMAAQVARFGRDHPLIKTQYFCEEIDAQAGMFPPGRQALMHGSHAARAEPEAGKLYAFLIDVAGQDECATGTIGEVSLLDNPGRDSTFLKIVELDLASVPMLGRPTYRVIFRRAWTGGKHVTVFGALRSLAGTWKPMRIVIDATGVGEGLWSLLDNALGSDVVIPVKFTASVKSELGYGFLGIVESGRYQEYSPFDETLRQQLDKCLSEIVPGPSKRMRWGVPDGTRNGMGELVHDDDLVTSALCTILDGLDWHIPTQPQFYYPPDPLEGTERNF